jgi:hypothetical protein
MDITRIKSYRYWVKGRWWCQPAFGYMTKIYDIKNTTSSYIFSPIFKSVPALSSAGIVDI